MPAKSDSQQQSAGAALSAKRGETDPEDLYGAAKDMYESMTEEELEDYAETSHKDKPEKKDQEKKGSEDNLINNLKNKKENKGMSNSNLLTNKMMGRKLEQIDKTAEDKVDALIKAADLYRQVNQSMNKTASEEEIPLSTKMIQRRCEAIEKTAANGEELINNISEMVQNYPGMFAGGAGALAGGAGAGALGGSLGEILGSAALGGGAGYAAGNKDIRNKIIDYVSNLIGGGEKEGGGKESPQPTEVSSSTKSSSKELDPMPKGEISESAGETAPTPPESTINKSMPEGQTSLSNQFVSNTIGTPAEQWGDDIISMINQRVQQLKEQKRQTNQRLQEQTPDVSTFLENINRSLAEQK